MNDHTDRERLPRQRAGMPLEERVVVLERLLDRAKTWLLGASVAVAILAGFGVNLQIDLNAAKKVAADASEAAGVAKQTATEAMTTSIEARNIANGALSELQEARDTAVAALRQVTNDGAAHLESESARYQALLSERVESEIRKVEGVVVDSAIAAVKPLVVPVGAVIAWPSAQEIPPDWHKCDGTPLKIEDYPLLAAAIEKTYGDSGSTHVTLPNFQGHFLRGHGEAAIVEGNKTRWYASEELGHWQQDSGTVSVEHQPLKGGDDFTLAYGAVMGHPKEIERLAETRPINYAVHWIIRVK